MTTIILLLLGIVCLVMENLFYGNINEQGIIEESFFLPVGWLFIFIALANQLYRLTRSGNR